MTLRTAPWWYDEDMRRITSHDPLQDGYTYTCTEPIGKHFADFAPELTPREMLELGVFGGVYFHCDGNGEQAIAEYPAAWFADARIAKDGCEHIEYNFFTVHASQPRRVWREKGWIHEDDPRGWVQWYFRYYLGRRMPEEDERQIGRWYAFRRHAAQVRNNCEPRDYACRPKQRQALLHWAYDSRAM